MKRTAKNLQRASMIPTPDLTDWKVFHASVCLNTCHNEPSVRPIKSGAQHGPFPSCFVVDLARVGFLAVFPV